jgi:alpha-D-ribose 1-methylphosphonate 5-triphosphate synthase subunit PhnH
VTAEALDHAVYRAVLTAMSRPGSVQPLPAAAAAAPALHVLSALLDHEASFHVHQEDALARELRRATGGEPAPLDRADFAVFPAGGSGGLVRHLKRGTLEYPDEGATALYLVRSVEPAGGAAVIRGPGIRDRSSPRIDGLAAEELALLRDVNRDFPLGVDAVFLDPGGRVLCLPRSTRIEVG